MNVADAISAIHSTLRPGRDVAFRKPIRDTDQAPVARRDLPLSQAQENDSIAHSSNNPPPKKPAVALIMPTPDTTIITRPTTRNAPAIHLARDCPSACSDGVSRSSTPDSRLRGETGISVAGLFSEPQHRLLADALDEDSAAGSIELTKLGAFFNALGFFGDTNLRGEEIGYDFHGGGVTAGVDYRFTDELVAGVAFGWTHAESDFDTSGGGNVDQDGYSGSLYGSYFGESFYVDGIFTYTYIDYDWKRAIQYPGFSTNANGSPHANQYALSGGLGYEFAFAPFWQEIHS